MSALGELPRRLRGYDAATVERLLSELEAARADAAAERERLAARIDELSMGLAEGRGFERRLREVLVAAQRDARDARARTALDSAQIVDEARTRASQRGAWLEAEAARLHGEIERIRALEDDVRARARLLVLDALARLDAEELTEGNGHAPAVGPPAVVAAATMPGLAEEPPAATASAALEDDTIDIPVVAEAALSEPATQPPLVEREAGAQPVPRERGSGRALVLSLAILAAGAATAVTIWLLRTDTAEPARTTTEPPAATTGGVAAEPETVDVQALPADAAPAAGSTAGDAPAPAAAETAAAAVPAGATLVVRASGGDVWLSIRAQSADGKLLFEGFLYEGESRTLSARRIWMRIGNPTHLVARLNGKPLRDLPPGTGDVLLTARGATTVALD